MSLTITLLELFNPLKRILIGDKISFSDALASINFTHQFPFILLCSIALGLYSGNPEDEKAE